MPALAALKRTFRLQTPPESRAWLPVLAALSRFPEGLRLSQLAEELHVDVSVASRQFARLERAGFAQRTQDPSDGRAQLLLPTDDGRAWLGSARDAFADRLSTLLEGWDDEHVLHLASELDRLASTIAAARPTEPLELASPLDLDGTPA